MPTAYQSKRSLENRVVVSGADEEILAEEALDDFTAYRLAARDEDLTPNFYLPDIPLPKIRTPK